MSGRVPTLPPGVLAVRVGPGANCSSVGSVIDLLFGAVVVSGVLAAAIHAAVAERRVPSGPGPNPPDPSAPDPSAPDPRSLDRDGGARR